MACFISASRTVIRVGPDGAVPHVLLGVKLCRLILPVECPLSVPIARKLPFRFRPNFSREANVRSRRIEINAARSGMARATAATGRDKAVSE